MNDKPMGEKVKASDREVPRIPTLKYYPAHSTGTGFMYATTSLFGSIYFFYLITLLRLITNLSRVSVAMLITS